MNWQTFITLIQNPSNTIFFISSTLDEHKIGSTMCALLNTNGGTLVIGYDKINIHLTGYNQTDQWIDQFIDTHFKNSNITSTFLFRSNKKYYCWISPNPITPIRLNPSITNVLMKKS